MSNNTGLSFVNTSTGFKCYAKPSSPYSQQQVDAIVASWLFKGEFNKATAQDHLETLPFHHFFLYFDRAIQNFVFCCRTERMSKHIPLSDILANVAEGQFNYQQYRKNTGRFYTKVNLDEATVNNIQKMLEIFLPLLPTSSVTINCLPSELVYNVACSFLSARDTLSLAQSQRCFFFADADGHSAGLVQLAKQKKLAKLIESQSLAIGGLAHNYVWIVGNKLFGWEMKFLETDTSNVKLSQKELSLDFLRTGEAISKLVAEGNRAFFLTNQGRWFGCGQNDDGQLGLGDKDNRLSPTLLPLSFLESDETVTHLVTGGDYSSLFTTKGRCFVWGRNDYGQLGLEDTNSRLSPTLLPLSFLEPGEAVISLVTGGSHNLLLTSKGQCFVWGRNYAGQLGLGDRKYRSSPALLPLSFLEPDETVTNLVTGKHNLSFLFTNKRRCFSWGQNDQGQLGLGDLDDRLNPTEISLSFLHPEEVVSHFTTSGTHNLLLTSQGRCFVWGSNRCGQLGLGDLDDRLNPTELFFSFLKPSETVSNLVARRVHTFLLTNQGRCFFWGTSSFNNLWHHSTRDYLCLPVEIFYPEMQEIQCKIQALRDSLQTEAVASAPQETPAASAIRAAACL